MNPFQSLRSYEEFVYTLNQRFPSIRSSSLVVVRRGRRSATLQGDITFYEGYRISIKERLAFDEGAVEIISYAYELWYREGRIAWYDSQPHPTDLSLASTHPHHKHVPPDIKHNRIPAPGLSFIQPNLPVLITEIVNLIKEEALSSVKKGLEDAAQGKVSKLDLDEL